MDRDPMTARIAEAIGWLGVGGVGLVMVTQAFGWNGSRLVATLQSLTPYGIPVVLVIAVGALWQRRDALATTSAAVGLGAFVLSIPLVITPGQPQPASGAAEIRVAAVNLLFDNPVVDEAADDLVEIDPDVIVFSEYTLEHQQTLLGHPLAERYAHQLNRDGRFARGMAVWSKIPLGDVEPPEENSRTVETTLDGPDGTIRLFAVHPPTPIFDFTSWKFELHRIGRDAADAEEPVLVIGDFNASYWHPIFRDLLDRGLIDAHMAHGAGWSTSWPTDETIPPFVRLDHALTGNGLVSTGVEDFRVPGSDHAGLVVTVTLSE